MSNASTEWDEQRLIAALAKEGGRIEGILPDPSFWRAVHAAEKRGLVSSGDAGSGWDAYEAVELTGRGRLLAGLPPLVRSSRSWSWSILPEFVLALFGKKAS